MMQTAAHYLRQEGREEGMQQGIQEGIQQAYQNTAKKMLKKRVDYSLIKEITGLSQQMLQQLKQDL